MQTQQEKRQTRNADRFSTMTVLIGLAVIWFALFIVFKANQLSTVGVRIGRSNVDATASRNIMSMEPRSRLLLPAEVHLPNLTPRQAIKRLATDIELRIANPDLERLANDKPVEQDLSADTVMMIMHRLIGNGGLGIAVSGERLMLIPQQVENPAPGTARWRARVEMDLAELSIAPLPDQPLWFTLKLDGAPDQPLAQRGLVRLEVWDGKDQLGSVSGGFRQDQAHFEVDGGARRFELDVRRLPNPTGSAGPGFELGMTYRTAIGNQDGKGK